MSFTAHRHKKIVPFLIFTSFAWNTLLFGHGFDADTWVDVTETRTYHNFTTHKTFTKEHIYLKRIEHIYRDNMSGTKVLCFNPETSTFSEQAVKVAALDVVRFYQYIEFDYNSAASIKCSSMQPFFDVNKNGWVIASDLQPGDILLDKSLQGKIVTHITTVNKPLCVYILEIENEHTFFVGDDQILTHNIAIPFAVRVTMSISFEGILASTPTGSFFGPK